MQSIEKKDNYKHIETRQGFEKHLNPETPIIPTTHTRMPRHRYICPITTMHRGASRKFHPQYQISIQKNR